MSVQPSPATVAALEERIRQRTARVAVIGLGYVGLPLAVEFAAAGFPVLGIDVDRRRVEDVRAGRSYVGDVASAVLAPLVREGRLRAAFEFTDLAQSDVAVICVQTPFTPTREPDLSFVTSALDEIRRHLHAGQLIVLQSTTYPGTTEEIALPVLASSGLQVGRDFFLAFSPERVDLGNAQFPTSKIPKVVGGITPACTSLTAQLFAQIVGSVHAVSSARAAELTKLLENVFRSVNIALVNELTHLCERMGVNIWEVVEAAATKPFGFMAFYPGPGVGGHCIPVDPYYLAWKAKEYDFNTKFIALAAEINENMPYYVADRLTEAVNVRLRKSIAGAHILGLGVAYKRGADDVRESASIKVLARLQRRDAAVTYHDPFVPRTLIDGREMHSVPLTEATVGRADCVVILTDHGEIDYGWVVRHAGFIFDTRNATRGVPDPDGKILLL